jgi:hypothetical protein
VIEIGPEGTRATAAPLDGPAHSVVARAGLDRLKTLEQKRYAFGRFGNRLHVQGSSSLTSEFHGNIPTAADIPNIRAALQRKGFLEGVDHATIDGLDRESGRFVLHDLLTGESLGQ